MSQKLTAANNMGTRVSLSPRNAPAAIPCTPSVMKKLAPMSSSVAASCAAAAFPARSLSRKSRGIASRNATTITVITAIRAAPNAIAPKPALRVATGSRAPDCVSDANGRGERDAERNHEQDGRNLQRDLMGGERSRADPAHQERSRGEQAPFEHEGAGDRQSDCNQLPQQLPVRPPESPEHAILLERAAVIANPDRSGAHGNIYQRGRQPGAEQIKARSAEGAVDQGISEQSIHGDGSDGDPERRVRTIDRAHEVAQRDEAPGRDHRPCQSGQIAGGERRGGR